jgi:hypothetical protein
MDLDASIVFAASEKENAVPTYKGGIGFCPNLASCDNTDDVLAIDPRPGGDVLMPPPTTPRTTPLCLTRRWPASRAATGAEC